MYVLLVFVAFILIAWIIATAVADFGNNKNLTFKGWVALCWSRFVNWCRKVFKKK